MTDKMYLEGNGGGDNFQIELLDDGRIKLKVGHCCVYMVDHILPVEWLTAAIATALEKQGVDDIINGIGWSAKFADGLNKKVEYAGSW